ncbi:hypothetical protein HDE_08427 [Halotydeus destructor]|nr:hypothetical protein HDE_08427 [Halotydeus destructor]
MSSSPIPLTQREQLAAESTVKLGLVKTLLVFLLFVHVYTTWYDYRIAYYHGPDPGSSGSRPLIVGPKGNLFKQPDSRARSLILDDVDMLDLSYTEDPEIPTAIPVNLDPPTPVAVVSLCLLVVYLILSLMCIIAVCGESYSLTYALAIIWTLLLVFDIGTHVAAGPFVSQYHHILASLSVAICLWYSRWLIKRDDILYTGHTLL